MERAARRSWKALIIVSFVGYQLAAHFVLRDSPAAAAVSGVTHAAAYLILLWYFGRTLRSGREPLITRLARSVHGSLPPEIAAFTRRVTAAWCVFFAAQVLLSLLLLALMFVGDHLYRAIRFPDYPRASIARILRAFAEVTSEREGTKAL